MLPAGLKGPAFLATNNFSVLKLYNNSDVYAIFVGHVADMIAANAPVDVRGRMAAGRALPPRPHPALPRGAGGARATTSARSTGWPASRRGARMGIEEQRLGLPLTCYPSKAVVDRVLKEASAAAAQ